MTQPNFIRIVSEDVRSPTCTDYQISLLGNDPFLVQTHPSGLLTAHTDAPDYPFGQFLTDVNNIVGHSSELKTGFVHYAWEDSSNVDETVLVTEEADVEFPLIEEEVGIPDGSLSWMSLEAVDIRFWYGNAMQNPDVGIVIKHENALLPQAFDFVASANTGERVYGDGNLGNAVLELLKKYGA